MKEKEKGRLRLIEKLGYGLSYFGVEALAQFNSYLTYFMTNVVGLSMGVASTVTGMNTLWNAVNDPLLGKWADNRRFKNGDRIRPFWLYCCLPMALFFVLMYASPELSDTGKMIYILLAYFLYDTFSTLIAIPNYGMLVLMTDRNEERSSLSVWAMVLDTVGITLFSFAMPLIRMFSGGVDEAGNLVDGNRGFLLTAVIVAVLFVASMLCAFFSTKERVRNEELTGDKMKLSEILRILFQEKNWVLNMLYMLFYSMVGGIVTGYLLYYTQYVLHNTVLYTPVLFAYLLMNLLGTVLAKVLNNRIGCRKTMLLGAVVLMVARIPSMIAPTAPITLFFNAAVMGIGVSLAIVTVNVVQANVVDLIAWKQKKNVVASASSVRSLIYKGSIALVMFVIGQILAATGYDAALVEQPAATVAMLSSCMSYIPFVLAAIMFAFAFFLSVDEETRKMKEAQGALAE